MKSIVIYTSKYGSTETYARWIAEALDCPAKKLQDVGSGDLASYDAIIYGGGVYASRIAGFKKFLAKLNPANQKTLILFMVGMTNPEQKEFYHKAAEQNIPDQWKGKFKVVPLQGDLLYTRMNGLHKLIMRAPKAAAEQKKPEERTADDLRLIENFGSDIIFADKAQIKPILAHFIPSEK